MAKSDAFSILTFFSLLIFLHFSVFANVINWSILVKYRFWHNGAYIVIRPYCVITGRDRELCVVVLPSLEYFSFRFDFDICLHVGEITQGRFIYVLSFSPLWFWGLWFIWFFFFYHLRCRGDSQGRDSKYVLSFSPLWTGFVVVF